MTAIIDVFLAGASLPQIANLLDAHVATVEARMREELHALARSQAPEAETPTAAISLEPKAPKLRLATKPKAAPVKAAPATPAAPAGNYPPELQHHAKTAARAVYDALQHLGRATVADLALHTGETEEATWYALNRMRKAGIAAHTDEQPYRWALSMRAAEGEATNGSAR